MNKKTNLGDALKAVGVFSAAELEDLSSSVILGTAKTLKESTWEKKVILGGLVANLAAGFLDLDAPFIGIGAESMAGMDSFVDNAADIAIGAAAASLAYKASNNIQEINASNKSAEELIEEFFGSQQTEENTTTQEKELFKKLLKKYEVENL